ncbi:MAG: hypothetical protein IJU40_01015, partial [Desulfovibrionaceae bacterium]|nr:hypothetical protein [Desulfovibrionaceae bacterium]
NGPSSPFGFPQNTPPPPPPSSPFGFPKPLDAAPQANLYNLIQGFWSAQIPEGVRSFRFEGNRYEQLLNGQVLESGIFNLTPDGRFSYKVTQGQFRGQRGENRLSVNGNTLTMFWPQGNSLTYVRGGGFNNPTPMGQSPLEGRWIWAKSGAVTFGFIFQGQNFISTWNNQERSRGTFTLTPNQIIMQHQTGPDAGKIDRLGIQISGNRFILFTSDDPNVEPIPFVRQ